MKEMTQLQKDIWNSKYRYNGESYDQWLDRISGGDLEIRQLIEEEKFIFAGRILANRGLDKDGIKVTYSNCYVIPQPEDSIESIFNTARDMARTYSYGGGVGIDISKLAPMGAKVNNSAKETTGAVSFMDLYGLTTSIIGQRGRRGALMISIDVSHPDIELFIDKKNDLSAVTSANISVKINNEFMEKATGLNPNPIFECSFYRKETGETITKEVNAKELFRVLCENNWNMAEPGILFWDSIRDYNLMSEDETFEYAGVNPCAEEPLPAGGSCLLGSFNLSAYVIDGKFDMDMFKEDIPKVVKGMNDMLDEGLPLHPLDIQKQTVADLRQIGIGVMGIADMLIKLGITYGSEEAIELCDYIGFNLADHSLRASSELAKEFGAFPRYSDKVLESKYLLENTTPQTYELIRQYGLRNSQILTIAPTGTLSTMWGISGGIEPIFAFSYTRKTESIGDGDVYYEVFTPIVQEFMKANGLTKLEELPEYFVSSADLTPAQRIGMQAVWQKHIDASISSTVNLPNSATVEDVEKLYTLAWLEGLKGLTIFRDGCKRAGILYTETPKEAEEVVEVVKGEEEYSMDCPECETKLAMAEGCMYCMNCGWGKCSI